MRLLQNHSFRFLISMFFLTRAYAGTDAMSIQVARALDEGRTTFALDCVDKNCTLVKAHEAHTVATIRLPYEKAVEIATRYFKGLPVSADDSKEAAGRALLKWKVDYAGRSSAGTYLKSEFGRKLSSAKQASVDAALHLENDLDSEIIRAK